MDANNINTRKHVTAQARFVRKRILQAKKRFRLLRQKRVQVPDKCNTPDDNLIHRTPMNTPLSRVLSNMDNHNLSHPFSTIESTKFTISNAVNKPTNKPTKENLLHGKVQKNCGILHPNLTMRSMSTTRSPLADVTSSIGNNKTIHVVNSFASPPAIPSLPPVLNTNNFFHRKNRPQLHSIQVNLKNKFDSVNTTSKLTPLEPAQDSISDVQDITTKRKSTTLTDLQEVLNHSDSSEYSEEDSFDDESDSETDNDDISASNSQTDSSVAQG
ncbi:hypothetical protein TSUD_280690 [Trifolium subterraneum]|uniref:Uncharacterized protein n=1 Tax=Trifolium subterraneum TaxID=3900 RepID=A0A2Z6PAU7_TRISU|nr:hypothetical protein TSUD_280690 [Trifolium subterraneum]